MYKSKSAKKAENGTVNIKMLALLTDEQKEMLPRYFGHSRFVYNHCLQYNQELYKKEKRSLNYYELQKMLPTLKSDAKTSFLSEVDSTSLQQAVQDYWTAMERFFSHFYIILDCIANNGCIQNGSDRNTGATSLSAHL